MDYNKAIDEIIARAESMPIGANEAETRLLLVNEVLTKVLGWSLEQFHPEEFARSIAERGGGDTDGSDKKKEWLDYHLAVDSLVRVVVEAKRVGSTFFLSADKKKKVKQRALLNGADRELAKAIAQANKYCLSVGTGNWIVTNGRQWIVSIAFAYGVAQEQIEAIVFYSLEDVRDRIEEFMELLSPNGVSRQNVLQRCVATKNLVPQFAKRLNDEFPPERYSPASEKNYLREPIRQIMSICFSDMTDDDHAAMLEACYVDVDQNNSNLREIESFVGRNIPDSLGEDRTTSRSIRDDTRFAESARSAGEPILVIGRLGSGKSTFLTMLRRKMQSDVHAGKWLILSMDLISQTALASQQFNEERYMADVSGELLKQAESMMPNEQPFEHEVLREVFAGEISRLVRSMPASMRSGENLEAEVYKLIRKHTESPLHHLKSYLGYLVRKGVQVTIILDNVDRGTLQFERVTFQLAYSLTKNTGVTAVVTIRESTYHSASRNGFLDVARPPKFVISPPPFDEVAKRRFIYAKERLRSDQRLANKLRKALAGFEPARLFDYLDILAELVLGETQSIREAVQSLGTTDVRRSLGLLEDFATSSHTNLEAMHRAYRHNATHGIHADFMKSIMLVDLNRYSETQSKIANVFQSSQSRLVGHFAGVRLLQFLNSRASATHESPDVPVEQVIQQLLSLGLPRDHIVSVVQHYGEYRLIQSMTRPEPPWDAHDTIRIGAAGQYYLRVLLRKREYVELLVDDTYVYDARTYNSIREAHVAKDDYHVRQQSKLAAFLSYLASQEVEELRLMGSAGRPAWIVPVITSLTKTTFGSSFIADAVRRKG